MNNLQLTKTGVDDYAVSLGEDFKEAFENLIEKAIDPLEGELLNFDEINSLIRSKKYPIFPVDKMPEFCKRFLKWSSSSTHCSDQAILVSYICLCGAALRKSVQIKNPTSWSYPNTWMMVLGKSGSAKSTGVDISLKMLRPLDIDIVNKFEALNKQYEEDLNEYEKQKKKKKKAGVKLEPPVYSPCRALSMPMIASLERYVEILGRDTSCGLINTSEEMATWLVNLNKVDNLKEFLTCTYNGQVPPNLVSYKNARFIKLDNPITSILGPSTIDWVFDNFQYSDYRSGFFQRLLFVINDTSKKPKARPKFLNYDEGIEFSNKLKEIYNFSLNHDLKESLRFELTEEAWQYFEAVFEDLQARKKYIQDDVIISCLDRYYNESLFKFALILHCMNHDFQESKLISKETFIQAHEIIKYFEASLVFTLSEIEEKSVSSMIQKIIDKLRNSPEFSMKFNVLADRLQGYARHKEAFMLAIDKLEQLKIIEKKYHKNSSNNQVPSIDVILLQRR